MQEHGKELQKLRNQFAGHVKLGGAEFATSKFTNETGKVVWNSQTDGWTIVLECTFAGSLLVGIICSTLNQNADYKTEWNEASLVTIRKISAAAASCGASLARRHWLMSMTSLEMCSKILALALSSCR